MELFEPDQVVKLDGIEMPEAIFIQHGQRRVLIPVENHAALSARVEPGMCVGTVTPVKPEEIKELNSSTVLSHSKNQEVMQEVITAG